MMEGIKIILNDLTIKNPKTVEFKFEGGINEFVEFLDNDREKLKNKRFDMLIELAKYISYRNN